ncbi:CD1871A family CXXC motif-containing protein [Clostridium estertheticum]|uniref:CD1871A family CXXC motif-containing protein n=1 Tax=Clostridium estertheticum TaxID=238834 RepID=UPI001CF3E4CD|nr:CD1871A family CXXC motif-containing protein [Clostridium estertheticum]MCB2358457.1 hypothetical protein [Clostridium estertheticum]
MKVIKMLRNNLKYWTLIFSLAFMTYGVMIREEQKIVLRKAINICLECIGVG